MVRGSTGESGKTRTAWEPGAEVQIGYMRLVVGRRIPTPGDGKPDKWLVHSLDGTRDYEFQPYSGLRLVADRRPKTPVQPKPDRRPGAAPTARANRIQHSRTDKGMGRDDQAVAMMDRLGRLEALLDRLGPALEREVRAKGKGRGR